jgi:hypothetical protein
MIRYLNFPQVPTNLTDELSRDLADYSPSNHDWIFPGANPENYYYKWTDQYNEKINQWCKEHISNDMWWAFQILTNVPVHKDTGTIVKLSYLIDTGGDNVVTNFYEKDQTTVKHSYVIEPARWHILKVDEYHSVSNVTGQRFSITGRIFPE